jgi:hypothetical protein
VVSELGLRRLVSLPQEGLRGTPAREQKSQSLHLLFWQERQDRRDIFRVLNPSSSSSSTCRAPHLCRMLSGTGLTAYQQTRQRLRRWALDGGQWMVASRNLEGARFGTGLEPTPKQSFAETWAQGMG